MIVYMINGVSGKVIYKYFEKKVKLEDPVDIAFSEHYLVVSFMRKAPSSLNQ